MEVWALEAHRAAYTLQEMLTIKSDDILGRARAFEAIVKGVEIPEATVPESFKVLVRELNALGLSIEAKGERPTSKDDSTEQESPEGETATAADTKKLTDLKSFAETKEVAK
jgi:DNA-directed RNA polymerase subunit beta